MVAVSSIADDYLLYLTLYLYLVRANHFRRCKFLIRLLWLCLLRRCIRIMRFRFDWFWFVGQGLNLGGLKLKQAFRIVNRNCKVQIFAAFEIHAIDPDNLT